MGKTRFSSLHKKSHKICLGGLAMHADSRKVVFVSFQNTSFDNYPFKHHSVLGMITLVFCWSHFFVRGHLVRRCIWKFSRRICGHE